jgi:hypothetical protein
MQIFVHIPEADAFIVKPAGLDDIARAIDDEATIGDERSSE